MSAKEAKNVRNSTVAISPEDAKRLDIFCRQNSITKKDFISLSLEYFLKNGINPAKHETPTAEIEKITKRMSQFFAFMKKQEQDILRPMYSNIVENQKENDYNLKVIASNQKVLSNKFENRHNAVISEIKSLFTKLDTMQKMSSEDAARLRKGLEMLLHLVDEKNKSGLMNKLFR